MEFVNIAYCGACGAALPETSDRSNLVEHIRGCEKHPLREALGEAERLRAEVARLTRERDAIARLLVVESLAKGDGWYVQEDLPPKVKGRYPTFEAAVAVVRKAAGLDAAAPEGVP